MHIYIAYCCLLLSSGVTCLPVQVEREVQSSTAEITDAAAAALDSDAAPEAVPEAASNDAVAVPPIPGMEYPIIQLITPTLKFGKSLDGFTSAHLRKKEKKISVAGVVDNFSKFTFENVRCTAEEGSINSPLSPSIKPGMKEGFASHNSDLVLSDSWVHCGMELGRNTKTMVHFMYNVPRYRYLYSNKLAVAICDKYSPDCFKMNAKNMYDNDYAFMRKGKFSETDKRPLQFCTSEICIVGKMGVSMQPDVRFHIYPAQLSDASDDVLKTLTRFNKVAKNWSDFVNSEEATTWHWGSGTFPPQDFL